MKFQFWMRRAPAQKASLDYDGEALPPTSIAVRLNALMNSSISRVFRSWQAAPSPIYEKPIRAELFSIERLEEHAMSLAAAQRITLKPVADRRLKTRLLDNDRALRVAYHAIFKTVHEKRTVMPAADWLVDNFHVVEEQVREIRIDLPTGFYLQLPKLVSGPLEGYPRVFGLAWAFVAHTDSRFDPLMLCRFVRRAHAAGRARGKFAAVGRKHRALPGGMSRSQCPG
jgi:hypothetical protein